MDLHGLAIDIRDNSCGTQVAIRKPTPQMLKNFNARATNNNEPIIRRQKLPALR